MKAIKIVVAVTLLSFLMSGCSATTQDEVENGASETAQIITGCFEADDIAIELQEKLDGVWTHAAPTHYAVKIAECTSEYPNGYVFEVPKSSSDESRLFRARAYGMHETTLSESGDLFSNSVSLEPYSDSITLGSDWK